MKQKNFFMVIVFTSVLLTGCTQQNAQAQENPSTSTDVPQSTVQSQSNDAQASTNDADMISDDEARSTALAHAGLTADQVTFIKSDIDWDNGNRNYDVEFYTQDHTEYDYTIDSYTGEVIDYDYDAEHNIPSSAAPETDSLTGNEAKQIVISQVPGATEEDILVFESDYDNGNLQYEGKLYYEQTEYEFEIDGYSGEILEWDVERQHLQ